MTSASHRQAPRDGEQVGHYQILRLLGQGGMAMVYDAYDAKHDRRVALKVLRPEWQRVSEAVARFLHEARAAGGLSGPHIATIYDSGEQPVPFIAMELVDGPMLAEFLRLHGRLPVAEAVRLVRGLGEALAYAHARGRIHRDIKPSNILLSGPERTPKLADFGIAVITAEAIQVTRPDHTLGTPRYMCPEQWHGEPADARCDLFSLGLTFYEMLTGRRAFDGETVETLGHQIKCQAPAPLQELAPQTPPAIRVIVDRLIAKRPEERFQSARELLDELDAWSRAAPRLARYVAVIVAAGFVVMVMVAGGAAVWWATPINQPLPINQPPPVNQPPVARSAEWAIQVGQALEIDLASLVSDADRDPLELAAELSPGTPGHLGLTGARLRYEPGPSFTSLVRGESRAVRILCRASDGRNEPAHAAILVRVAGTLAPNRPPIAANDGAWTRASERIAIDVLANDADPDPTDRPRLVDARMAPGSPGSVRIADGRLDYDPGRPPRVAPDRIPIAQIRYAIADRAGARAEGRAWIRIEPPRKGLTPRVVSHDDRRCQHVVERFQLGGVLSDEERELLQSSCPP
jgi:protein kinase-like protein/Big-like domain-containing protein